MRERQPFLPVLLVGAGRMGGALLNGWISNNIGPLAVVEPNQSGELRRLARSAGVALHRSASEVTKPPLVCVIALKPQILKTEASRIAPIAHSGALMISIAAGAGTRSLRNAWGKNTRIIRAMPNTPGRIGHGISALYAGKGIPQEDRKLAESLLAALGETIWVARETLIDSVTAVSGSGPAYVFLLAEALARAAKAEGLPQRAAEKLARATVAGSGALLDADVRSPDRLRRDVTSPGGTTEAALKVLEAPGGLKPLIARAVHAARRRAAALALG